MGDGVEERLKQAFAEIATSQLSREWSNEMMKREAREGGAIEWGRLRSQWLRVNSSAEAGVLEPSTAMR